MNPSDQQNQSSNQQPPVDYGSMPPDLGQQTPLPNPQQIIGTEGATYIEPAPQAPPAQIPQPVSRGAFAPDMQPGVIIPGDPKAPINGPNKKPAVNPNSTQNNLQIAEVRDGIVIMNDGSFRSVVMVKSINFDLMSPTEREGVEYSYQSFLNSLYFPIQIFVRSQKVDISGYIHRLDKIRTEHDNMLLAMLMDDYLDYIDQLAAQTNIMDKHFYVVIPYFPVTETQRPLTSSKNLLDGVFKLFSSGQTRVVINEGHMEEAKAELRNRVQAVLGGLLESGIQGIPLDTQELIELYYDTYNPDTATRQKLKNFDDLTAPVITKGEGTAPQPHLEKELQ